MSAADHWATYRAMLGVPLLRRAKVEGVFVLTRAEPGLFTERQIELVQTFADQAVIAIENVRLFDEVQARTRDLTEALQQQTATADVLKVISRSAFDLQAVFDTLIGSAVELCGAFSGTICVRDGDVFRYRGSAGPGVARRLSRVSRGPSATPGRRSMAGACCCRARSSIPDHSRGSGIRRAEGRTHGHPARPARRAAAGKDGSRARSC
jgi:hypothetical protein